MSDTANRTNRLALAAGIAGLAAIAAAAVLGWVAHGEAIFLDLAANGWLSCL
ncbi:hypothetical protein [Aurantimonas sp. VKM B-3413]|uniref:hypothetical protein n=1 Tax=Aurantimonas sp. VKM B-3413 TaxID=2779401 RepID=UPI001E4BC4EC|nr:hypothetical protein [Aurantimonas sp. VKM B-3413]MCB8837903.1 hypothetical protein [Aurantimonas sp. VKM B-3413]